MSTSIHLLPSSLAPCAFCEDLLDREDLYHCASCGLFYCGTLHSDKSECQCRCGIPTAEESVAAALDFLIEDQLAPTPTQTFVVEDEGSTFFGIGGPTGWLLNAPQYEDTIALRGCLPIEFGRSHSKHQQIALNTGHAGYLTENFAMAIKRFDIGGRIFTVSVFHPFTT